MTFIDPASLQIGVALTALILMGLWSHRGRRRRLAEFLGGPRAVERISRSNLYRLRAERVFLLGGAGVAIAMRPGTDLFRPEIVFAMAAGISFAGINLTARWLRDTETTFQLVFFGMAGIALLSSLALPFQWRPMPATDVVLFAAMAAATLFGYIFMTRAFMVTQVGVVAPFEYTVLIWAVIWGLVIWGDWPGPWVWTGATIIVASGLYLFHREAKRLKLPKILDHSGYS